MSSKSKRLAAAVGGAAVAAGMAVSLGAGTAGATAVTQPAVAVVNGTPDSSSTASYSGGGWTLESPATAGSAAQLDLVKPAQLTASSPAPTFTASTEAAGDPRWVIEFHNGDSLFGYGASGSDESVTTWVLEPQGKAEPSWSAALADVAAGGADDQVTAAFIVMDSGSPHVSTTLTNVTYNGEAVAPVSNAVTQSTVGQVKNANSGKCLDVAGGAFADGGPLQQWTCGAEANGIAGGDQKFEVVTRTLNGTETGYLEAVSPSGQVFYVTAGAERGAARPVLLARRGHGHAQDRPVLHVPGGGGQHHGRAAGDGRQGHEHVQRRRRDRLRGERRHQPAVVPAVAGIPGQEGQGSFPWPFTVPGRASGVRARPAGPVSPQHAPACRRHERSRPGP